MQPHRVVSREEWLVARRTHLAREKAFTKLRDELSAERRALPWVKVDKPYRFEGPKGGCALADLFGRRSQLIVYHFMFGPDWAEGCPSCSFWADNFNGIGVHLAHRDIALVAVSRAPLAKLTAYAQRMGWAFAWYSSLGSDFNFDYGVSFTEQQKASGALLYNYGTLPAGVLELPGISVFAKGDDGTVFHTYSCYARGLDMVNGAYHYMDLAPKGRDEDALQYSMQWVRRHDRYEDG